MESHHGFFTWVVRGRLGVVCLEKCQIVFLAKVSRRWRRTISDGISKHGCWDGRIPIHNSSNHCDRRHWLTAAHCTISDAAATTILLPQLIDCWFHNKGFLSLLPPPLVYCCFLSHNEICLLLSLPNACCPIADASATAVATKRLIDCCNY